MNTEVLAVDDRYHDALVDYVSNQSESSLSRGYEWARRALMGGTGILELLNMHHDVLLSSILGHVLRPKAKEISQRASEFLHQTLAPYDMAIREVREKNETLLQLNLELERRVEGRTRELQENVERLQGVLDGTIKTMSFMVETRDPYTAGHERRVSQLASATACEMGLSETQVKGIRIAGLLHDIGKIAVPAEILSKPGEISENEFGLIKGHCRLGSDMLRNIQFPWPVAQTVLQHHERMDGSGYPLGITGEDIILQARVLAVADVVEAMASHRPYRPALGVDRALAEVSQQSGVKFDPAVVDACLRAFNEKKFAFE